jgi:site-specific DNA-methyltransferase (adenine-specific)
LKAYIFDFFKFEDDRGRYRAGDLTGPGVRGGDSGKPWGGYDPTKAGRHWQPASYIYEKYTELTQDDLSKYPLLERLEKMDEVGLLCWNKARTYPSYKAYLDDKPGTQLQDLWSYVPGTKGCIYGSDTEIGVDVKWLMASEKERLGYPTQKPEGLLTRIINSSCPDDGIVLDPFCGCGTTIAVAEKMGRNWIGIDLTYIAVNLMRYRLNDTFGESLRPYEVIGVPTDLKSAEALAIEDEHSGRYQFQWWALSLVDARRVGDEKKKGADQGKDGLRRFYDDTSGKSKTIVFSVKSGNVGAKDVRDLIGAVNNTKAQIGCLITLRPPTKAMRDAATEAGFYKQEALGKKVPKIQILTVGGLLDGTERLAYHKLQDTTFQQAPKAEPEQQEPGLF